MDGCRWIEGDPVTGTPCGRATIDGTWCKAHREIVYPAPGTQAYREAEGSMVLAARGQGRENAYFIPAAFEAMNAGTGTSTRDERRVRKK